MRSLRRRAVALLMLTAALLADGLLVSPAPVLGIVGSPVAQWKLDDGANTTADDFIGTANGTVAGGATWITSGAAVGTGALHLDGTNDFVTVPSSSAIEPTEATITVWVRGDPAHPPRNGDVIVEKGSFNCTGPSYGLYVAATGFTATLRGPDGIQYTGSTYDTTGATLWNGAWHLVALSLWNNPGGTQAEATVTIDGYPWSNATAFTPQYQNLASAIQYAGATHSELVIGGPVDATCGHTTFKGDIDDVRMYPDPDRNNNTGSNTGILMPAETVTLSGLADMQAHPGEQISPTVDVSPAPRWGKVSFDALPQVGSPIACCNSGPAIDLYWTHPDGQNITATGPAPLTTGTFTLRASFSAGAPYVDNSTTSTLTVTKWPSTATVQLLDTPPVYAYDSAYLDARVVSTAVTGTQYPTGTIKFWDTTPATPILLGTKTLFDETGNPGHAGVFLITTGIGGGTHKIKVEYMGDSVHAPVLSSSIDVTLAKRQSFIGLTVPPVADANQPFTITANVSSIAPIAPGATVTFRKVGSATPICTVAAGDPTTSCLVPGQAIGSPQFTAEYSGNADTLGVTSSPTTVTVVADTARATGVGVQYTTFYPYKDSYKDTDAIKGHRDESESVTIKIYNPSGSLYKTVSIATGTGDYSYVWNGRLSDGTIKAEGQYKIVQALTDNVGHVKTVTSYITLSKKKLVYTTKTITKTGSSLTAKGTLFGGTITVSTTSGYTKLSAASGSGQWAGAGWSLTLPSATIYSSFYVRVYGRRSSGTGTVHVGAQQFTRSGCAYSTSTDWDEACFGQFANIPVTSGTTLYYYKTVNLSSEYRSGTHVRVEVSTTGGTVYIYKAQVIVKYGYLTY